MAEKITLNSNTTCGGKVAVDLDPCDACAAYQLFKLAFGGLNTFTLVTACAGLPVDVKNATIAVTDNCGALTVDGTVTANLSCTDNTVLDNIQTAVQVIDNSVYVDDADWTDGSSSHTLVGGLYQSSPQTVTDGDVAPFNITVNGALHTAVQNTVTVTGDCGGSLTVDNAGLTELAAAINSSRLDVGNQTNNIAAPGATNVGALVGIANTCPPSYTDGRQVLLSTNLSGAVRVTTSDCGGLLVNLGGNNDVTVTSGCITADLGANNDVTIDGSAVIQTFDAAADFITCGADTAIAPAFVRDDALSALTPAEGDYVPGFVTQHGALWTALVDACGSQITCFGGSASVYVDDADWTDSTSSHTLVGGLYQSSPQTVTDGDVGPFNMTTNGALHVAQQGTVTVTGDCSGSLTVDGTVAVSSITTAITPGVAAANLGKAEDAAHTSGDTGVMALAVRNDTLAALAGTSGDYAPLQVGATGALYVRPVGTAAGDLGKAEDAAHASGHTGVMALAVRNDQLAALAGTDGDYAPVQVTEEGGVFTHLSTTTDPGGVNGALIYRSLDLDETEEQVKATGGNLYGYYFANRDACTEHFLKFYNATAATVVVGTTTPVLTFPLPAGTAGHISFPVPISFATAMTIAATTGVGDCSSAGPGANEVVVNVFYR